MPSFILPTHIALRTPRLSLDQLNQLIQDTQTCTLIEVLRQQLQNATIYQAIVGSTPELTQSIQTLVNGGTVPPKLQQAIWRYLIRMGSRATPFGEMAAIGMATISNQALTPTVLSFTPHHRLDSTLLSFISRTVETDPAWRPHLQYRLNDSSYTVADQLRFSYRNPSGEGSSIGLMAYPDSYPLKLIREQFTDNPCQSWIALVERLKSDFEQEDTAPFVHQLIDDGLLISELALRVTGPPAQQQLLAILERIGHPVTYWLEKTIRHPTAVNREIMAQELQSILGDTAEIPSLQHWLQTDTAIDTKLAVSPSLVKSVLADMALLQPLLTTHTPPDLTLFARTFRQRYEGTCIPLLIALDPLAGIGYQTHHRADDAWLNQFPVYPSRPEPLPEFWHQLTTQLYAHSILENLQEVEVTPFLKITLAALPELPNVDFPAASAVLGELYEASPSSNNPSFYFHLKGLWSPSASQLLGRFCYLSEEMTQFTRLLNDYEQQQQPHVQLAEIVHFSANRIGNIVSRPTLRDKEIPYLTPPGTSAEGVIPLTAIGVQVDSSFRVHLVDTRSNQPILPRLTSAHNTALGDEIYSFLADVKNQQRPGFRWDWSALGNVPFLPRITLNRLILCRARWSLNKNRHSQPLRTATELTERYRLPNRVVVINGDQELLLDLSSPPSVDYLWERFQRGDTITLFEWLSGTLGPDFQPWCRTTQTTYSSEWVLPLLRTTVPLFGIQPLQQVVAGQATKPTRRFYPGGEWVYLKVYSSVDAAEIILTKLLPLIVDHDDLFHFVRYADPAPHLRLRWHCSPNECISIYTQCIHKLNELLEADIVYKIEWATYERELERYTPVGMAFCEALFDADSRFVLSGITGDATLFTDTERYRYAISHILALLALLELGLPDQLTLLTRLQGSFLSEQPQPKASRDVLNSLYREHQAYLLSDISQQTKYALDILSVLLVDLGLSQAVIDEGCAWLRTRPDCLRSVIHMSMNRLFVSEARHHELVVYHFLFRHLTSQVARQSKQNGKN